MIALDFSKGGIIPYYIKVILIPEDGINTPHLCFSSTDSRCLNDRQAFATNTDGKPAIIFIKREQIINSENELFLLVTCEEEKCGYILKFYGSQTAEIDVNSVFSTIPNIK